VVEGEGAHVDDMRGLVGTPLKAGSIGLEKAEQEIDKQDGGKAGAPGPLDTREPVVQSLGGRHATPRGGDVVENARVRQLVLPQKECLLCR